MLAYHIGFWAWKGTTFGGIVCQLRVVRLDGSPLRFVDALVRGIASLFSIAVVGLGCLWILKDEERQSWHDKIAGTYVVTRAAELAGRVAFRALSSQLCWSRCRQGANRATGLRTGGHGAGRQTSVECRRGCELAWVERGLNPSATPQPTFTFNCGGTLDRCSSYKIGGWVKR